MYRLFNRVKDVGAGERVLYVMMFLDFMFTYVGINILGVISEGNPLMVWLFNIPFTVSLLFRIAMVLLIRLMLNEIKVRGGEIYSKCVLALGLILNVVIAVMHVDWVLYYLL